MFSKIKEFFTGKKPEVAPEAPYKVETAPINVEAEGKVEAPAPAVESVVVVPEAVVPAAVVEQAPGAAPATKPKKAKAPAKPKAAKPAAPKKPRKPKVK